MKRTLAAAIAATCLAILSPPALGQAGNAGNVTRLTGSLGTGPMPVGRYEVAVNFSCDYASGAFGPCTGSFQFSERDETCSNYFRVAGNFVLSGLDFTRPGAFSGTINLLSSDYDLARNPDGSCTFIPLPSTMLSDSIQGTWDGTTGILDIPPSTDSNGKPIVKTGSFRTTSAQPVFPMTVTSNITQTVSSASAVIQYRPQDVGTTGSVYVFAVAPSTVVKAAADGSPPFVVGKAAARDGAKADAVACVLAQLNASGELQTVSSSAIQAYVTGVLSSQGQAVSILNGVPTANIGGATFFVGYGASSSAMIGSGINRSAVTIPATRECRPQPPQTGWWWNANEGGRGYSIEVQGNNLFMASYLYDVSGRATWHVAAGPTSLDGSVFSGALMSFGSGVTLNGPYRTNARLPDAGSITLAFDDATHGTLVWPGGTVALTRYAFGASGVDTPALAGQPESGWWWGGTADNGRGFFIEWQGARAFIAGYMYDAQGNAIWYVADSPVTNALSFSGTWLQFANGQTLTGAYRAPTLVNGSVAPVTIQFLGATSAILTLPSGTLPLSRFVF